MVRRSGNSYFPLGLGVNGPVLAMDVAPDGTLVVAGNFTLAGGGPATNVARWSNGTWSSLGGGITLTPAEVAAGSGGEVLVRGSGWLSYYNGLTWSSANLPGPVTSIARDPIIGFVVGGLFAPPGIGNTGTARFVQGSFSYTISQPLLAQALGHDRFGYVLAAVDLLGSTRILRLDFNGWTQIGTDILGQNVERLSTMPNGDVLLTTKPQVVGINQYECSLLRWNGTAWVTLQAQLLTTPTSSFKQMGAITTDSGELLLGGFLRAIAGQAAFSFAIADAQCPAAAAPFGTGCVGGNGPLALTTVSAPWIGGTFLAKATGFDANSMAVQVLGAPMAATPLPSSAGGCFIYTTPSILDLFLSMGSDFTTGFVVPRAIALVGLPLRMQLVSVEILGVGSTLRLASTNALDLVIGSM